MANHRPRREIVAIEDRDVPADDRLARRPRPCHLAGPPGVAALDRGADLDRRRRRPVLGDRGDAQRREGRQRRFGRKESERRRRAGQDRQRQHGRDEESQRDSSPATASAGCWRIRFALVHMERPRLKGRRQGGVPRIGRGVVSHQAHLQAIDKGRVGAGPVVERSEHREELVHLALGVLPAVPIARHRRPPRPRVGTGWRGVGRPPAP